MSDFRVALINPASDCSLSDLVTAEYLGLEYLAAVLRENNCWVRIYDASAYPISNTQIIKDVYQLNVDVVGVSPRVDSVMNTSILVNNLKRKSSGTFTVLGGRQATFAANEYLTKTSVDAIVRGEGEITARAVRVACARITLQKVNFVFPSTHIHFILWMQDIVVRYCRLQSLNVSLSID